MRRTLLVTSAGVLALALYRLVARVAAGASFREIIEHDLWRLRQLFWEPERGLTLREECAVVFKNYVEDSFVAFQATARLTAFLIKVSLRAIVFAAPSCQATTLYLWEAFWLLDRRTQLRGAGALVALLCMRKVWQKRYIGRALDLINIAHYRVSKFLTFVGPYILVLLFAYLPLKCWRHGSPHFRAVYTNVLTFVMILCSLKTVIEYTYAATQDPYTTAPLRAPAPSRLGSDTGPTICDQTPGNASPLLVDKLRLLVTPRIPEARISHASHSFDAKHRTSNAVIVSLSCWLGLGVYHFLAAPKDIAMFLFARVAAFNLWLSLYGFRTYAITSSLTPNTTALFLLSSIDEIAITIVFIGILARDNTLARYARNLSALLFDAVLTKLTGFSVRTIPNENSHPEPSHFNVNQLMAAAQFLPYGYALQQLLSNWQTVRTALIHFLPAILLVLPKFVLTYVVILYAGIYPFACALRAAVSGNAAKSNYWLSYFVGLFTAILLARVCPPLGLRSSRGKLLLSILAQYCIDSPRQIVYLASKVTTSDDQTVHDGETASFSFRASQFAMESAPPTPGRRARARFSE